MDLWRDTFLMQALPGHFFMAKFGLSLRGGQVNRI